MQARMPPSRSVTAGRKVCSVWCGWFCGMACYGMARHGLSWLTMASSLREAARGNMREREREREKESEAHHPHPEGAEACPRRGKMASGPRRKYGRGGRSSAASRRCCAWSLITLPPWQILSLPSP